jgi:hypothetical protein
MWQAGLFHDNDMKGGFDDVVRLIEEGEAAHLGLAHDA